MNKKTLWSQSWLWRLLSRVALLSFLSLWANHALAGTDLLEGSLGDMNATLQGSGRRLLYVIEGISALIAYRSTKNIYLLGSILAVALFINVLLIFAK